MIIGSCASLEREVGNGIEETKTIGVPSFEGISYDLSDDLIIKQGEKNGVKLTGDSNILEHVELEVREGVLYIDLVSGSYVNISMKVEVTLERLNLVENTGSGNVSIESGSYSNGNLTLITDGSGDIRVEPQGELQEINLKVEGSGDITFDGATSSSRVNVNIDGSGDISGYSLTANSCNVFTDGSGDVHVHVLESLVGTIEGNGNIYYKGTPQIQIIYEGSGELINKN